MRTGVAVLTPIFPEPNKLLRTEGVFNKHLLNGEISEHVHI